MCALDENQFLLYQQTSLAVKVHISACVRQNSNSELKFETNMAAYVIALCSVLHLVSQHVC